MFLGMSVANSLTLDAIHTMLGDVEIARVRYKQYITTQCYANYTTLNMYH